VHCPGSWDCVLSRLPQIKSRIVLLFKHPATITLYAVNQPLKRLYPADNMRTGVSPHQPHSLVHVLREQPTLASSRLSKPRCTVAAPAKEQGWKQEISYRTLPETHFCYVISKSFQELKEEKHPSHAKIKKRDDSQMLASQVRKSCLPGKVLYKLAME